MANQLTHQLIGLLFLINEFKQKFNLLYAKDFFYYLGNLIVKLIELQEPNKNVDDQFPQLYEPISFIQQVFLKAEWRRIGTEIEKKGLMTMVYRYYCYLDSLLVSIVKPSNSG